MPKYEVSMPGTKGSKYIYNADYFEIEEGGVIVFYQTDDPHDGQGVSLGDVANSNDRAVRAFKEWESVDVE